MALRAIACAFLLAAAPAISPLAASDVTYPALPRELSAEGPVSVRWDDPAGFTELRHSANRWNALRGDWVRELAAHLRERAAVRLAPGERLEVTITDIKRAGDYEPWQGIGMRDVRVIRDIYPPRITLAWRRTGADGGRLDEGTRTLVDGGFLAGGGRLPESDPLRHEKDLIERWVRDTLVPPGA